MADTWPFPGDTELTRARKAALAYRAHLHTANPQICAVLDETLRAYGQHWLFAATQTYDDNDCITTQQAAELLCISVAAVRQLRIRGRLKAIHTPEGWRYQVTEVRAYTTARLGRPRRGGLAPGAA
jgi:hypothetical protein